MSVCCCSLAGTAACQHCRNNPYATDLWTNKTVTVDHIEAKPFGNGLDVCPVCGKPSTIGKPQTNADRIRSMTDEELAKYLAWLVDDKFPSCCEWEMYGDTIQINAWLEWLGEDDSRFFGCEVKDDPYWQNEKHGFVRVRGFS